MGLSMEAETWVWYAIAMTIIALRYISRTIHLGGVKRFQPEDYAMMVVTACYTVLTVTLTKLDTYPTNLIPPDEVSSIDPASIPDRIYGSKLVIVVEQFWCATIWGCKACLLFLYANLTTASRQRILVYIVSGYVAINYCIMIILFFGAWCRPFSQYWAVPVKNDQCSTYHDHLVLNAVFNISSDVMMLFIPLPILWRLKLELKKKIILMVVFSLGLFVILSAILSKYYSFHLPYGVDWVYWYVREVSTSVIVANIPHCWALVRRAFNVRSFLSNGGSFTRSRGGTGTFTANAYKLSSNPAGTTTSRIDAGPSGQQGRWYKMKMMNQSSNAETGLGLSRTESEEQINQKPLEIYQNVQYTVENERATHQHSDTETDSMEKGTNNVPVGRGSPDFNPSVPEDWKSKTTITTHAIPPSRRSG